MSLIPPIRFFTSERYALLATSILLNGEIMSFCFYCIKKGLVYIIITELSGRQPFFILSVPNRILVCCIICARFLLISVYFLLVLLVFEVSNFLN